VPAKVRSIPNAFSYVSLVRPQLPSTIRRFIRRFALQSILTVKYPVAIIGRSQPSFSAVC